MFHWKLTTTTLLACSLALATACGNSENAEVATEKPVFRFGTLPNLSNSLLPQIDLAYDLQKTSSIKYPYCIHTVDMPRDAKLENDVLEWSTTAMNSWIEALIGEKGWRVKKAEGYRVEPDGTSCPKDHNGLKVYEVKIKDDDAGGNKPAGLVMNLGGQFLHPTPVLHEMGHACGLADTRQHGNGKEDPIGHRGSIMECPWSFEGELQSEDISGIRFLWAKINGEKNTCPDGFEQGYILHDGELKKEGPRKETYCINLSQCEDTMPDCSHASAQTCESYSDWFYELCCNTCNKRMREYIDSLQTKDNCPDDPDKTEPGECGCGVQEGTCNDDEDEEDDEDDEDDEDEDDDEKDNCPDDPDKTEPGECGCGVPEGKCDDSSTNGLLGEYFDNEDFTSFAFERVEKTIDFDWGNGSPSDQIDEDTFSVRWTGFIKPKYSEEYKIYTTSDDGIRLWVDNKLIIDNWTLHGPTENTGTIDLQANKSYSIKIEYFEHSGGATAKLLWSSDSQSKQTVPNSQLFVESNGPTWN